MTRERGYMGTDAAGSVDDADRSSTPDYEGAFMLSLPFVCGVSRLADNDFAVLVSFKTRLSDDQLRQFHEYLAGRLTVALSETGGRSFSDFIRNATPEEKSAVYEDVMKRASERQNACGDKKGDAYKLLDRVLMCSILESRESEGRSTVSMTWELRNAIRDYLHAIDIAPQPAVARIDVDIPMIEAACAELLEMSGIDLGGDEMRRVLQAALAKAPQSATGTRCPACGMDDKIVCYDARCPYEKRNTTGQPRSHCCELGVPAGKECSDCPKRVSTDRSTPK